MRWVYIGWMILAFPIGWTVSQVMLAVMFFGLFTPIGLVFRLIGRDPLHRGSHSRTRFVLVAQARHRLIYTDTSSSFRIFPATTSYDGSITMSKPTGKVPNEFEKAAVESQGESLVGEFWAFLAQNKKWWLLPIMIVMLLLGTLILLSGTAAAPFIYTLF